MIVLVVAAILSLPAAATCAAVTWARVVRAGRGSIGRRADAIVVFGAQARPRPSPELLARLAHAAALYREGRAPLVVCCGGFDESISEARAMAEALRLMGVPVRAIAVDERGRSTRETLRAIRERAAGRWRRVIGVSSPFHLHRIAGEARRHRLECLPSAGADSPIMRNPRRRRRQIAREVVAVWWYALSWAWARHPRGSRERAGTAIFSGLAASARAQAGG